MLYALLIYEAESTSDAYTDVELEEALRGHRALQADAKARGHFVEANQLAAPRGASSLVVRDGSTRVTDGPFTETKELLVGYYVVDVDSLELALEYAARIPHAATGGIEIRPVEYFERRPAAGTVWNRSQ